MNNKLRKKIDQWLTLAGKVYHNRKDVMETADLERLETLITRLQDFRSNRLIDKDEVIESCINELIKLLERCGGTFYPKPFWAENAEMFIVAAILAIGIRTFFFQPFKIPTNSMYPTYNGMTHVAYEEKADMPSGVEALLRKLALWSTPHVIKATESGEKQVGVFLYRRNPMTGRSEFVDKPELADDWIFASQMRLGRNFFILPSQKSDYYVGVGDSLQLLTVPADFTGEMYKMLPKALFSDAPLQRDTVRFAEWKQQRLLKSSFRSTGQSLKFDIGGRFIDAPLVMMSTGQRVEAGEHLIGFEILTGDMLFVDRFSYHFAPPQVGDPFVFRTGTIPSLMNEPGAVENYYIKRCAGVPGDSLEIRPPKLIRNGKVETSRMAFLNNAERVGEYEGYSFLSGFNEKTRVELPKDKYFALGDNSDESKDSRDWGYVPEDSLVGKALFIYYPFSHRWGIAK